MHVYNKVKFPSGAERRFILYRSKEAGKVVEVDATAVVLSFAGSHRMVLTKAEIESIWLATYGSDQSGWVPPADDTV